jgi:hypothetical protein
MKHLSADTVYTVSKNFRGEESNFMSLQRLRALRSGIVVALGSSVSLKSYDRGLTWDQFDASLFGGEEISDIAEDIGRTTVLTRGSGRSNIWVGDLQTDQWIYRSDLPEAFHGYLDVSSGIITTVLQNSDNLQIFVSVDGTDWVLNQQLTTSGTLNQFEINASGVGIGVFLDITEMLDGSDFKSTILALDIPRARLLDQQAVYANIQSTLSVGKHKWFLGASSGTVLSYDSASGALKTRLVIENAELNIVGIHEYQGRLMLVAEESDPPGRIWMIYEDSAGQMISVGTDIRSYTYGSQLVGDGLLILTATAIYRIAVLTHVSG